MNKRLVFVSTAFALALPFALSGCGNKGPLVLADDPPAAPAAVAPAEASAPATGTAPSPAADAAAPPPPADGTPAH